MENGQSLSNAAALEIWRACPPQITTLSTDKPVQASQAFAVGWAETRLEEELLIDDPAELGAERVQAELIDVGSALPLEETNPSASSQAYQEQADHQRQLVEK